MRTDIPTQPNLDDIEREAKILLHALRRGDAAARSRYCSIDPLPYLSDPRIEDAQYIIAREHSYSAVSRTEGTTTYHEQFRKTLVIELAPGEQIGVTQGQGSTMSAPTPERRGIDLGQKSILSTV